MIVDQSHRQQAKPMPRCVVFIAAMLGMFAVGILLGEMSAGTLERMARISGAVATIVVLVVGIGMVTRMRGRSPLLAATVAVLIAANVSYAIAAFAPPVVNILFDVATLMVMLLLQRVGLCSEPGHRLCLHAPRAPRGEA